ncbi:MAG: glycoside hydrolase [Anaerocolumna sp.]|nr:glycoside hydrolase [Anaerocolumna sp.]
MPRSTKDWIKITRGFLEGILLLFLAYIIIKNLYVHKDYVPYQDLANQSQTQSDKGFIALSYFGVAFSEDSAPSLISRDRLGEHLKALTQSGYVTITQQDIIDYYKKGKMLPNKSLFLMFADGRSDTAIFAGQVLKEYNLKASILTYAQNVVGKDNKFLHKKDLNNLGKNSFWEFGSGGYRLTYINVFDHMGKFLNVLTSQEFNERVETIETDYNHYLMDYIRDENRIPVEDISQLTNRINYDYNEMVNIYEYALDKVPLLYSLMHSNTGKFGTNNKASIVNEENIKNTFQINFNRDGYAANTGEEDLYDLTRLSPKPDWYTNHLLMRIWQDTGESLAYQYGDEENLNYWDINLGQPEFLKDTIILTSPPEKEGILFLKNNELKNQELSVDLLGKQLGDQTVYLRAKKDLSSYISVSLSNNELLVVERKSGKENVLFSKELKDDNGEDKDDNKEDKENWRR